MLSEDRKDRHNLLLSFFFFFNLFSPFSLSQVIFWFGFSFPISCWTRRQLHSLGKECETEVVEMGRTGLLLYNSFLINQPECREYVYSQTEGCQRTGRNFVFFACLFISPRISLKSLFSFKRRLKDFVWRNTFFICRFCWIYVRRNNAFYRNQKGRCLFTKCVFCQQNLKGQFNCFILTLQKYFIAAGALKRCWFISANVNCEKKAKLGRMAGRRHFSYFYIYYFILMEI